MDFQTFPITLGDLTIDLIVHMLEDYTQTVFITPQHLDEMHVAGLFAVALQGRVLTTAQMVHNQVVGLSEAQGLHF